MHEQHQFAFDDVFAGSHTLSVLDNCLSCLIVGIDEVGNILAGSFHAYADRLTFEVGAAFAELGRDKFVGDLLGEVGDDAGALPHSELGCAIMFLSGGVAADAFGAVLVPPTSAGRFEGIDVSHW